MLHLLTAGKKMQLFLLIPFLLVCSGSFSQTYINGNLSTGNTTSGGAAAPAGFNWSELQNGNTNLGFGGSIAGNLALADDFIVPSGQIWNLTNILVYAYSTNYSGATSPFNDLRIRIYNSDPSTGTATPVFGDLSTNRLASSAAANIYRIGNNTPGTARLIWGIVGNLSFSLNPGRYWIEWQTGTVTGVTSNFTPTSTVVGTVSQPGNNAWQHNLQTNAWNPVVDQTSSTRQDFPFVLTYTISAVPPCSGIPAPGNTISSNANVCFGQDFTLSLQNNPVVTGLTYQWQSSPDAATWSNITAANAETFVANQASSTYYRCLVSCGANTTPSNPLLVSMFTSGISAQPSSTSGGCSESAFFRITTSGTSPVLAYQWQQRPNVSSAWTDVINSQVIRGANDDTLSFLQLNTSLNGYQFRALYLDTCGNVYESDSAILTVDPITANINPSSASVCNNTPQLLTITGDQTTVVTFNSGTLTLAVPDTVKAGATNSINVTGIPAGAVIQAASVTVNAIHSSVGDLAISLKAPNASVINLDYYLSGNGPSAVTTGFTNTIFSSNGSYFVGDSANPYTGFFRADGIVTPITNFPAAPNSMPPTTRSWQDLFSNPNGNWTLGLYDGFVDDIGQLTSWSLEITYSLPATAVWTTSAPGTIFTDAAGTVAYTAGTQAGSVYVRPSGNAAYSAVTSNSTCGSSAAGTANITIQQSIGNLTGPDAAFICPGSPALFTVNAGIGTNISYQWEFSTDGGSTWQAISGATAATLSAGPGSYPSGSLFRAILSNGCGNPVISASADYTILSGPSIVTQPSNFSVCANGNASYSVTAAGSSLNTYQWQVSTNNGTTWTDVSTGGNSSSYSFTATAGDNGNLYRVVVGACGSFINSTAASLTILTSGNISVQPAGVTICTGTDAVFSATAVGSSFQWQVSTNNGTSWNDIPGATSTTLTIPAANAGLSGNQYRLQVGNCGVSFITSSVAVLTVTQAVSITTQPSNLSVCAGGNGSFSVTASGSGLAYLWQESADNGITWTNITGATSASYDLNAVVLSSNGTQYRVLISGNAPCSPVISNAATLTVNPLPVVGATVLPSDIVCEGTNITLTGTGAATYNWSNGISNGVPFIISTTTSFTVTGTSAAGCENSESITIIVNPAPTVSVTSSNGNILQPGASTTLTATSTPTASSYAWYRNGQLIPGVTGNNLNITFTNTSDLGSFYAIATTSDGCSGQSQTISISPFIQSFISPNPNRGDFLISLPLESANSLNKIVSLYDSKGALVYQGRFSGPNLTLLRVNTSGLSSGHYVVRIHDSADNLLGTGQVIISSN